MKTHSALVREAQHKIEEARGLVDEHKQQDGTIAPDVMRRVNELLAEAEQLRGEAEQVKQSEATRSRLQSLDTYFNASDGRKTTEDTGEAKGGGLTELSADIATHNLRFGEMDAAVKTLARDLYGKEYEQKRMAQVNAFGKYVRYGDRSLTGNDRDVLYGEPIMTPSQIKWYAGQGVPFTEVKATLVEAADNLGGVLVPEDMRLNIIQRIMGFTVVRQRATVVTTQRDAIEWPKVLGGDNRYTSAVRATWVNETPTAGTAASNPTFGFERIPIHTLMIETFLSRNLLEDVAADIVGLLTRQFAEAAAMEEDECFLVGTGVGKPQGILPGGANTLSLTEVVTGSASAITADGVRSLKRGIARQYRDPAVFIMESATAEDIELLKDGEGRYFFDLDNDQLLRKPLLEDEAMPSVGASTYPIIYGDLGGYFIGDRIGMTVERYLDSATARINQVVYVMRRRLGGQVIEPWRFAVQKCST